MVSVKFAIRPCEGESVKMGMGCSGTKKKINKHQPKLAKKIIQGI